MKYVNLDYYLSIKLETKPNIALISILSHVNYPEQRKAKLLPGWGKDKLLRLCFDDVEIGFKHPVYLTHYVPFTVKDADLIIDFHNRLPKEVDTVYVACEAGVSRSYTIATNLARRYHGVFEPGLDKARHLNELINMIIIQRFIDRGISEPGDRQVREAVIDELNVIDDDLVEAIYNKLNSMQHIINTKNHTINKVQNDGDERK